MQLNCPVCHATFPIESALQHEAGREVMAMLAGMQPDLSLPLMHYIGYFRPAKQQLGWGRALRLMREVVGLLPVPAETLVLGLVEAARGLDEKRAQPGWKPLGNHNYLKRCLESAQARHEAGTVVQAALANAAPTARLPRSQAGQALVALEGMKG
ncbi:hypothetical protein [Pseudaquabacterium pictum]|uniref:Uncharacterized protein n=1 Tax=Pseudaquabacterium pictum TaxID=2315236 RepID=A0A480AS21_9BURK|nr:hypothetical protein [Rubrivivax pictus]GCL64344.1 hypothetical protein AQPW35_34250 [Rubrivivax pictus]